LSFVFNPYSPGKGILSGAFLFQDLAEGLFLEIEIPLDADLRTILQGGGYEGGTGG
jgi:hypothetical protein